MCGSSVSFSPTELLRPLRRLSPVVLLAALAGACSSGSAPTTYDLSAPATRIRGSVGAQVLVAQPAAIQPLSSQQILVKDASGAISNLGGGQWADELPALVQARLINTFENASLLRAVARPSSGAAADVQLVTELRRFEVATPSNEAVVEITAKIVSDQTGRIVAGRIFRAATPVASVDAANAVRALDESLSTVMLDIVRWVSGSALPRRDQAEGLSQAPESGKEPA